MMNTVHKKPRNPTQQAFYCQVLHDFTKTGGHSPFFSMPAAKNIEVNSFFTTIPPILYFEKREK